MSDRVPGPVVQPLARPVSALYGVGPERAGQLGRLGIATVEDLLLHRPRRYEDRTRFSPIGELRAGEAAVARGRVVACGVKWFRQHSKSIFELILEAKQRGTSSWPLHARDFSHRQHPQHIRLVQARFKHG